MICIFERSGKRSVISSASSADWYQPGDAKHPDAVFKSEAAFIKKWKALERAKWKLVGTESIPPRKRKAPQKYTVKVTQAEPLLGAFAAWLKAQPYGAVGWFELVTERIPKRLTPDVELAKHGRSLLSLPDGSRVVADRDGGIVFLDSEGGAKHAVAPDLAGLLAKLASGRTGVDDLDDKAAGGRKSLGEWLAARSKQAGLRR